MTICLPHNDDDYHKLQLGKLEQTKRVHLNIWWEMWKKNHSPLHITPHSNTVCKHIIVYVIRCLTSLGLYIHTWVRGEYRFLLNYDNSDLKCCSRSNNDIITTVTTSARVRTYIEILYCICSRTNQKRTTTIKINANAKTLKLLEEKKKSNHIRQRKQFLWNKTDE